MLSVKISFSPSTGNHHLGAKKPNSYMFLEY